MSKNCVEIIQPFISELDGHHRLQVIGSAGSFALSTEMVEIHSDEKVVYVPGDTDFSALGQIRNDGNLRDLDVQVMSTSPVEIGSVKSILEATVGDQLLLSVFGLKRMSDLHRQQAHPVRSMAKAWVADRYVTELDGRIFEAKKALFPFAVDIDPESLETWQLEIGKAKPIPVPHPGMVVLNYLTRSISGLRPKDAEKIDKLAENIFAAAPDVAEWIIHGPGQPLWALARIFHGLREPANGRTLTVGGKLEMYPAASRRYADNPSMLLRDTPYRALLAASLSGAKARALHAAEKNQKLASAYQKYAERHLSVIVGNQ